VPRAVSVLWLDSGLHIDHGWASAATYKEGADLSRMTVLTVGLLMDENEDRILVGLNYDEAHEAWIGAQAIARSSIQKLEYLS
jgi:hypothetical protein